MKELLLTEEQAPRSRRGLLRTLFTAPIAALATHRLLIAPTPIVTVASAEERLRHHVDGVEAAMQDLFPMCKIDVRGNCLDGGHDAYLRSFARGDRGAYACAMVMAGLPLQPKA